MIPPADFACVRDGRISLLVRTDIRGWIEPLLRAIGEAGLALLPPHETHALSGGRGGAHVVTVAGHEVVVRPYRRGGLPARVIRDTYLGWSPRPFRELCVTASLRQRGAPVIEVYGAGVRWLMPGCYKGWLATRYVSGARTLWEWTATPAEAAERAAVLRQVGRAIRRLHACGGRHPDLNLNNILICPAADPAGFEVRFIDFDRPAGATLFQGAAEADLARLRRSAHKLDPEGVKLTATDLDQLCAAYREAST